MDDRFCPRCDTKISGKYSSVDERSVGFRNHSAQTCSPHHVTALSADGDTGTGYAHEYDPQRSSPYFQLEKGRGKVRSSILASSA